MGGHCSDFMPRNITENNCVYAAETHFEVMLCSANGVLDVYKRQLIYNVSTLAVILGAAANEADNVFVASVFDDKSFSFIIE